MNAQCFRDQSWFQQDAIHLRLFGCVINLAIIMSVYSECQGPYRRKREKGKGTRSYKLQDIGRTIKPQSGSRDYYHPALNYLSQTFLILLHNNSVSYTTLEIVISIS